jgi:hypothetical protein
MKSPDKDIRVLLAAIATANSLKIYDRVPESENGTYVHIQDISSSDNFTADRVMWETELLLDIVSKFDTQTGGRATVDTIGNTIMTALVDQYQSMTEFKIVKSTVIAMNYVDESQDRGYIIRKLLRLNLQIESLT